jgi:Flp pilus assembly protein TadB
VDVTAFYVGGYVMAGLGVAAGVAQLFPRRDPATQPATTSGNSARSSRRQWRPKRSCLMAAGAGAGAFVVTGWPVGALLAVAGTLYLPALLAGGRKHAEATARIEAVAGWTELLRDTVQAAAGIIQALIVTGPLAPDAIRPHTTRLADKLRSGTAAPVTALLEFAEELADPYADSTVLALIYATENPTRDLAQLLSSLARNARDQAAARARTEIHRARTRSTVRVITGITLGLAGLLLVADRSMLAPFNSADGQFVLLMIGLLFAGGYAWLARLAAMPDPPRLLAADQVASRGLIPAQPDRSQAVASAQRVGAAQ